MRLRKKQSFALITLIIFAFPLIQSSAVELEDLSTKEIAPRFLSEVIGLDLTKYNMTKEGYGSSYPSWYGGEVKEEVVTFELASDQDGLNNLRVSSIFRNGFICTFILYEGRNSPIYLQESSTDAVYMSKNILQRYKVFAQNLGRNTEHIDQALTMLNNVSAASSKGDLPMFNNVFGFVPSVTYEGNMKLQATEGRVRCVYIEKGTDMTRKRLSINFGFNALAFSDTWDLFRVGSLSVITEEEAKSIGWEAAKNFNVTFTYENGTTVPVSPKWSNVSEIEFNMIPGQMYKMNQDNSVDPGSVTRDPLALYPHWQMKFYFEMIGGAAGVQVGVWGDTKEIAYISLYGYYGAPTVPDTESTPENQPQATQPISPEDSTENSNTPTLPPTNKQNENKNAPSTEPSFKTGQSDNASPTKNNNPTTLYALSGITLTAAVLITIAWFVLKKKRK